ncbi:MBL fold metallo-hydrolase [Rhodobium gokarnense]|uniref:7, 8-dihydropterin-6-yl-methyl-4-(Beta-D-ribofuranosyl)aminobenzene 5'-phosphate synthase n=1 Tax=Rhodobium gokarnense TaxID=364296 RepID=A0ABT3HEV4_9HYPH|nr:MBL fold metallo-hydrolase [Rhodobium gokarnense]MCW2308928.1 7,8-dihydropterin-6-yl-methyl-4-(beta-D-ribofuranosyl)aminobenzene 5'-phosphate synthase [Rhodobium gokarnense]
MIQITTVVENSPGEHKALRHEHGLCFHIDTGSDRILFDTGASDALLHNAEHLRLDLKRVGTVVLSHGHYDHTGGLRHLASVNDGFELVTGKGFFVEKYAALDAAYEFLGNDFDEAWLAAKGITCRTVSEPISELVPGVHIITDFERTHGDEVVNPRFKLRTDDGFVNDTFSDEVMLAIETPPGIVAVVGCSHPGIRNLLDTAEKRLGRPIHAVLGGTHLMEATPDRIAATLDYLDRKGISVIGASHCTGPKATEQMKALGARHYHNRTGTSLVFH